MIQNRLSGRFVAKPARSVLQKRRSASFWMVSEMKEALGKGVKRLSFRWVERLKTGVSRHGGAPEPKKTTPDQKRCHSLKIRINREKKASERNSAGGQQRKCDPEKGAL
jgi:hypothetical protein